MNRIFFIQDSYCQTYEQQWQTTIQNGQMNLSRVQTPDESNRRQSNNTNGTTIKKDSNNPIPIDHNIHAKVQLQLDMLDCNYEQDKREYYAQLIRDFKKTTPIHELDKELKTQVRYSTTYKIQFILFLGNAISRINEYSYTKMSINS